MIYTVKKGDTLSAIAKKYNVTVEALVASNSIKNKDVIFIGQVLKIPENKAPDANTIKIINDCVSDIQNLPSFKRFMELIENG